MSNKINPAQLNDQVSNLPLPTETVRLKSGKNTAENRNSIQHFHN